MHRIHSSRLLVALAAAACSVPGWLPRPAAASCNLIPAATVQSPSTQGTVDRAFAAPGDTVTLRTTSLCDPGNPGFAPLPADNEITLRFEPPSGLATDVAVAAVAVDECDPGGCDVLSFAVPDTDALVGAPGDGRGLAGKARILIARPGPVQVAEIGPLHLPTDSCDREPEPLFEHFTVLPLPNDFAALEAGTQTEVRATLDGGRNLLIPFDFGGVLALRPGDAIFRVMEGAADVAAFDGGAPLVIPDSRAVRSFSKIGRPIPPILRIGQGGTPLYGTVDAASAVLRIQRENPNNPDLYDFTDRFVEGKGPVVIPFDDPGDFVQAREPAPLQTLSAGSDAVAFGRDEAAEVLGLNGGFDADQLDQVVQILDVGTGASTSTGVAAVEISVPNYEKLALATEGSLVASLESEARNSPANAIFDRTNDLDAFDSLFRVHDAAGNEITFGQTIPADPTPLVNRKPLVVDGGLVFFRTRESDGAPRQTRRLAPGLNPAVAPSVSHDGRFVAVETTSAHAAGDTNGVADIYVIDRDSDEDGIFDEPGATASLWASVDAGGGPPNAASQAPSLSADGRHVAFHSNATDIVSPDTNNATDVFVRDLQGGATVRVSQSGGVQSNRPSVFPGISGDGELVIFTSGGGPTYGCGNNGIILADRDSDDDGEFDEAGDPAISNHCNASATRAFLSADGSTRAFFSNNNIDGTKTTGHTELWILRAGQTRRMPTVDGNEPAGPCDRRLVSLSADGRFAAVNCRAANFVEGGPNSYQTYVYDFDTHRIDLVSRSTDGQAVAADTSDDQGISADGRFVSFESTTSLAPNAIGPTQHVYVHDRVTNTTELLSVNDAGAPGDSQSRFAVISGDGRQVAFFSAANNFDGSATNGTFTRGHDPDAEDDGALDPGISLNAADGDALDTVLRVYDPSDASVRTAAQVPAGAVAVRSSRAAILVPEAEDGGLDRNGDGDALDRAAHLYDGLADQLVNLGVAAEEIALSDEVVCLSVSEAAHGGVDRSGDGVANDRVLGVWTIGTPPASLVLTGHTVASLGAFPAVEAAGARCVFASAEAAEGAAGADLNGDGDTADVVLRVLDGGTVHDLAAAEEFVVGDTEEYVAVRTCEADEGNAPLNADGDTAECVMQVVDLTGPAPAVRNTGRAASLCTFPGCDPFFEPYRVRRATISFLSRESEQSGAALGAGCLPAGGPGDCDFTADGDALDLVIQVYSARAEAVQSFEIREDAPPEAAPPFPEGSIDDQTVLYVQVPELTACKYLTGHEPLPGECEDLNGDGVVNDEIVLLLVGDADEDGTLDDAPRAAESLPDNCGEEANEQQTDADGDQLGDDGCDPSPFSFTPGATVCDVDSNGQIDADDVAVVFASRGQSVAFPPDLRDADEDAAITVLDSAACADRCTYADCATSPPPPPPPNEGCGLLGPEGLLAWFLLGRRRAAASARSGPPRRAA